MSTAYASVTDQSGAGQRRNEQDRHGREMDDVEAGSWVADQVQVDRGGAIRDEGDVRGCRATQLVEKWHCSCFSDIRNKHVSKLRKIFLNLIQNFIISCKSFHQLYNLG